MSMQVELFIDAVSLILSSDGSIRNNKRREKKRKVGRSVRRYFRVFFFFLIQSIDGAIWRGRRRWGEPSSLRHQYLLLLCLVWGKWGIRLLLLEYYSFMDWCDGLRATGGCLKCDLKWWQIVSLLLSLLLLLYKLINKEDQWHQVSCKQRTIRRRRRRRRVGHWLALLSSSFYWLLSSGVRRTLPSSILQLLACTEIGHWTTAADWWPLPTSIDGRMISPILMDQQHNVIVSVRPFIIRPWTNSSREYFVRMFTVVGYRWRSCRRRLRYRWKW